MMSEASLEELDGNSLDKILELIYKFTGITMGKNKKTMIQGRLRPRIRELGLDSYGQYIDYLLSHKLETQEFINLLTTNETSFFRTQRVWDFFNNDFLPNWEKKHPGKTLKIWSGASSSGEEVYSIGICCEEFRQKHPQFNYSIYGTDISTEVLRIAEKGLYIGRSIEHFKNTNKILFDKYMKLAGEFYQVHSDVRSRIRFNTHNLYSLPLEKNYYDIVFLRNVLIYFEAPDQEKVLANMGKALINNGTLIVGESESLASLKTPFQYKSPLVYEKGE